MEKFLQYFFIIMAFMWGLISGIAVVTTKENKEYETTRKIIEFEYNRQFETYEDYLNYRLENKIKEM